MARVRGRVLARLDPSAGVESVQMDIVALLAVGAAALPRPTGNGPAGTPVFEA